MKNIFILCLIGLLGTGCYYETIHSDFDNQGGFDSGGASNIDDTNIGGKINSSTTKNVGGNTTSTITGTSMGGTTSVIDTTVLDESVCPEGVLVPTEIDDTWSCSFTPGSRYYDDSVWDYSCRNNQFLCLSNDNLNFYCKISFEKINKFNIVEYKTCEQNLNYKILNQIPRCSKNLIDIDCELTIYCKNKCSRDLLNSYICNESFSSTKIANSTTTLSTESYECNSQLQITSYSNLYSTGQKYHNSATDIFICIENNITVDCTQF